MPITQLHPQQSTGRRYGSFVGKPAGGATTHPVGRITQLHPQCATGRRYGSFAGRAAGGGPTTHPVARITQLHPQHATGGRYGSFDGRAASVAPATVDYQGDGKRRRRRKRKRLDELVADMERTVAALVAEAHAPRPGTVPVQRPVLLRVEETEQRLVRAAAAVVGESDLEAQIRLLQRELHAAWRQWRDDEEESEVLALLGWL